MKKIITILFVFLALSTFSQIIQIDSASFAITHTDLNFYLDADTNSFVSIHTITYDEIKKLDQDRSNKWHKEKPFGPYHKDDYVHTGYDLGHLTPSHITSYDDSLNYHSFSFFNQAPQYAGFNRGKWAQLEAQVVETILSRKEYAVIITGVIYDNNNKEYLSKSRIKVPVAFYKILVTKKYPELCWIGSNNNGQIITTDLKTILDILRSNGNHLNIIITH